MTKKDYELIAGVFNDQVFHAVTYTDKDTRMVKVGSVLKTIIDMADALEAENPRFDRTKFIEACGHSRLMKSKKSDAYNN